MTILLTNWPDADAIALLRTRCSHCGQAVSIEYERDDESAGPMAWTCPDAACRRPGVLAGVRDIRAVWPGHGARPRLTG